MSQYTPITISATRFKRRVAVGLFLLAAGNGYAQVERTDSLNKITIESAQEQGIITNNPKEVTSSSWSEAATEKIANDQFLDLPMTYQFRAPLLPTHITGLPQFDLASSQNVLYGLGDIRRATISYNLTSNRWLFDAALTGEKYKFQQAAFNNLTLGGGITYQLSDHWSISAFGTYSVNHNFYSMAAYPYISQSQYGGTMNYQGEKLGIRLGAHRFYDPFSRRWITEPIIAPNIKVGKMKMEMNVGPLVLDILQHLVEKSRSHNQMMQNPPSPSPPRQIK